MAVHLQVYDKLLNLPLFQGMGHDSLWDIVEHVSFGFHRFESGDDIVRNGELCDYLFFILSGEYIVTTFSSDRDYRVEEEMSGICVIEPERLFALNQRFMRTYTAKTACQVMFLAKKDVQRLLGSQLIFRMNFINLISTQSQKQQELPWRNCPSGVEEHVIRFFMDHCQRPFGRKEFHVRMTRIADEVNDSRLDVSKVLNRLQAEGLLELYRARILIPELEKLPV